MNTKRKVIIGEVQSGSFHFNINFKAFNFHQTIPNATFDTGCSHSLISINSLDINNTSINQIKVNLLYSKDSLLYVGKGVESSKSKLNPIKELVKRVNDIKKNSKDDNDSKTCIKNQLTKAEITQLQESKNIRFAYHITDLHIDGVYIGDYTVHLAFNTEVNLIGMHIIKDLYTKIYTYNGLIHLYAIKREKDSNLNDLEALLNGMEETIELYNSDDPQVLSANLISQKLKNNQ